MGIESEIRNIITKYVSRSSRLEISGSAYRYKHMIERMLNQYITEDQFIKGMEAEGFVSVNRGDRTFFFANFTKLIKADQAAQSLSPK